MAGLLSALEIGRRALLTTQQQLAVNGQNIANADRVGYRRREAVTQSTLPIDTPTMELGTGVQVVNVIRAIDQSLESSLRQSTQSTQYHQTMTDVLSQLENRLAPGGNAALDEAMVQFENDLQRLTASPETRELRLAFLNSARSLASQIHQDAAGTRDLRDSIVDANGRGTLPDTISQINTLSGQIAALNGRIVATEQSRFRPQQANELRDQRDELLGNLATLTNFTVSEQPDGSLTLRIGTESLVNADASRKLALDLSGTAPVVAFSDNGAPAAIDAGQTGAMLGAWQYLADHEVELDVFAQTLATETNALLAAGFDLDGNAGAELFSGSGAADIAVALNDTRRLGLSDAAGSSGNGKQAAALLDHLASPLATLGNHSLSEYPNAWIGQLAGDVATSNRAATLAAATEAMYTEAVASKSGVSLDEEMVHMLQLQRTYQASAKFVAAVDEMLQQALAML